MKARILSIAMHRVPGRQAWSPAADLPDLVQPVDPACV